LTFVVPVIFFSIFAVIFGSRDASSSTPKIKIAVGNGTQSVLASQSLERLKQQASLRITEVASSSRSAASPQSSLNKSSKSSQAERDKVEDLVRRGMVTAGVVFHPPAEARGDALPTVEIMTDSYDQVASQVLTSIVREAVMSAHANQFSVANRANPTAFDAGQGVVPASFNAAANTARPMSPNIEVVDVIGGKKSNPVVAMYAAGIAVMFLLFSATTASGSLLEEKENSTLDRLLCSRLSMDHLLLGKWLFLTLIGILQMTLMFAWGAMVFKIDLLRHWEGFLAMTLVTAGAAASFALMLAAMCKSRMQLGWVSTIVILTMSALGGSMVPRYLMSESMQRVGLLTFNAWALEGYNKVFWRELPLQELQSELMVLTFCGLLFIVLARLFSVRWERS
jgi:ABC-2 type transport system permease protein